MNILPSLIKFRPSLKLAITISDSFVVIRPYLDSNTARTIVATSIVHSKLDYCNSLYYNLPKSHITRLQLLSLTYKVLTTTQPPYLHNLISVQPPRNTRSSYHVTLARPPTSSSLRIADRSFRYASPCLWNQFTEFTEFTDASMSPKMMLA